MLTGWKVGSQICAVIGVGMSAMATTLMEILPHPVDNIYAAVQTGVIAVGLYMVTQIAISKVVPVVVSSEES